MLGYVWIVGWLQVINEGGKNVVTEVWEVLDKIKAFSGIWACADSLLQPAGFGFREGGHYERRVGG
jgi:hypothetical protein